MVSTSPDEYQARFIYGAETRCAFVSYRGKSEYIGPFTDEQSAIDAAKAFCRARGWTGQTLV